MSTSNTARSADGDAHPGTIENIRPALMGRRQSAAYCSVSVPSWDRLSAGNKTPAPVRLGGRVMWRRADLDSWIAAGCPPRE